MTTSRTVRSFFVFSTNSTVFIETIEKTSSFFIDVFRFVPFVIKNTSFAAFAVLWASYQNVIWIYWSMTLLRNSLNRSKVSLWKRQKLPATDELEINVWLLHVLGHISFKFLYPHSHGLTKLHHIVKSQLWGKSGL